MTLCFCEWRVHPHDEERGGGTSWGVLPLGGCLPLLLYIDGWRSSHMTLIPYAPWLASPPSCLAGPLHEQLLRRSPAQDLLHHHHHYVVVLLEFPRIRCFRCPTRARDGGRRRTGRVTEYGGPARLWRHHRDLEVGRVHSTPSTLRERYPASGLRG